MVVLVGGGWWVVVGGWWWWWWIGRTRSRTGFPLDFRVVDLQWLVFVTRLVIASS